MEKLLFLKNIAFSKKCRINKSLYFCFFKRKDEITDAINKKRIEYKYPPI